MLDDATATVQGEIVDAEGNTNSVLGTVERTGKFWVEHLPLASGTNTVLLTVTDAAGNASITNFSVVQSDVGLTLDLPTGDTLYQKSATFQGVVSNASCALTVNGISASVDGTGGWVATNVPLPDAGVVELAVVAALDGTNVAEQWFDCERDARIRTVEYHKSYGWFATPNETEVTVESSPIHWQSDIGGTGGWQHFDMQPEPAHYEWPADREPVTTEGVAWYVAAGGQTNSWSVSHPTMPGEHSDLRRKWYPGEGAGQAYYFRKADKEVELVTGGKADGSKSLFVITASTTEIVNAQEIIPLVLDTLPETAITTNVPYEQVSIGNLGTLDADGKLYVVLPNGTNVMVTPRVAGKNFYGFNVWVQKHRLIIKANGQDITSLQVREIVGAKDNFSCEFSPAFPITNFLWDVEGKIVADWIPTFTNALKVEVTNFASSNISFAWYGEQNGCKVSCTVVAAGLTLSNATRVDVFRPQWRISALTDTVSCDSNYNRSLGEEWLHYGGRTNSSGELVAGVVFSRLKIKYDGTLVWVQTGSELRRIKKNGSWRRKGAAGLDNQWPYPQDELGRANDSPGQTGEDQNLTGVSEIRAEDSYDICLMFRPPGAAQSVWVPLRKLHWTWSGIATFDSGHGTLTNSSNPNIPPSDMDAAEYPVWESNLLQSTFVNE